MQSMNLSDLLWETKRTETFHQNKEKQDGWQKKKSKGRKLEDGFLPAALVRHAYLEDELHRLWQNRYLGLGPARAATPGQQKLFSSTWDCRTALAQTSGVTCATR